MSLMSNKIDSCIAAILLILICQYNYHNNNHYYYIDILPYHLQLIVLMIFLKTL